MLTAQLSDISLPDEVLSFIARLITGEQSGATRIRGTYGIRCLFERCGLPPVEYQGQPKEDWTREILRSLSMDGMVDVLARLVSVAENGDEARARAAFDTLNIGLLRHGMQLALDGDRHILATIEAVPSTAESFGSAGTALVAPDFEQLDISDDEARRLLIGWDEATRCYSAGAYLASMVMLGSLLEAVLLLALKRNREKIAETGIRLTDNKNNERPIERWSLSEMIDVSAKLGWTTSRVTRFAHSLREYRNYVHPELQKRLVDLPKSYECLIGSIVVSGAVQELSFAINTR